MLLPKLIYWVGGAGKHLARRWVARGAATRGARAAAGDLEPQSGLSQAMNANQESVMGYVMQAMASGELDESSLGISEQELAQIDFMAILKTAVMA